MNHLPILIGLLLGIKHAFDADHIVAVSTIATEEKTPLKTALIGAFWGIGHTATLFLVGLIVLLLKLDIPDGMGLLFELFVGVMLVCLGVRSLLRYCWLRHQHLHTHLNAVHTHVHTHENKEHFHRHHQSFAIGLVHGLAGSGTLLLLVLSTIRSSLMGIIAIFLFGLGSIVGMTLMSIIITSPLIYSANKLPLGEEYLRVGAGVLSFFLGFSIIYEITIGEGLLLQ